MVHEVKANERRVFPCLGKEPFSLLPGIEAHGAGVDIMGEAVHEIAPEPSRLTVRRRGGEAIWKLHGNFRGVIRLNPEVIKQEPSPAFGH